MLVLDEMKIQTPVKLETASYLVNFLNLWEWVIKVQILFYESSKSVQKYLVSRTIEISFWLVKTEFDKKKWQKCLMEIQES